MNYKRVYMSIIRNRKQNPLPHGVGTEVHHIIPRSLGGSDSPENLVRLSSREHFLVHALLVKIFAKRHQNPMLREKDNLALSKMYAAFHFMRQSNHYQNRYFNSHLYHHIRKNYQKFAQKYSREQLSDMFAYYCKYDCGNNKEAFADFQQHFNYHHEVHSLRRLFLQRGYSLTEHKQLSKEQVKAIFTYYCCENGMIVRSGNAELKKGVWKTLSTQFGFNGNPRTIKRLFEKHGFCFDSEYKEQLQKMFANYCKNRVLYKNDFTVFCEQFNYPFSRKSLLQSFKRAGFDLNMIMN